MFKSLKQLFADLQDKQAGEKISQWPVKTPLILYTKFYAILVVIVVMTIIYSLVYFIPQLPKIISQTVPDVTVSVKNSILEFSPSDPLKFISPEGSFVIDTREKPDDYSSYPVGAFVFRDRIEARESSGVTSTYNFQKVSDFQISKDQIVTWLSSQKTKIILILIPVVILVSLLISSLIWSLRLLGFYIASAILYFGFKLFQRPLAFGQIVPVVIYASILPLLISYVLFFAPHPLLSLLNFALFVFFTLSWLLPLTKKSEISKTVRKQKK